MAHQDHKNSGGRMPQAAHRADVQYLLVGGLIGAILLLIVLSLISAA